MITSPAMGLKRWDQPNDVFSYTELSDNFGLLDAHDHSTGKGVRVPTDGIANLAVTTTKIANSAVDSSKIGSGSILDSNLASPNNVVWRTLAQASSIAIPSITGGTIGNKVLTATGMAVGQSDSFYGTAGGPAYAIPMFPLDTSFYSVAGKTTKLRLVVAYIVSNAAPVSTMVYHVSGLTNTSGLNTVTASFATPDLLTTTLTTPAANARGFLISPAVDMPAPGAGLNSLYTFTYTNSATYAANASIATSFYVQVSHV